MGRLAARRMAATGATVAAVDVNEAGLRETASGSDRIHPFALDVTDGRAVAQRVREVESAFGPIDRVYNAAAIMPTSLLLQQEIDVVHRIMAINYGGVVNVTYATLPGMLERGSGELVNFASIAGWLPAPHFGAYNASKFAVVAFTEVLYHENRNKGVKITCVCPPPVATPLLDQAKSRPRVLEQPGMGPIEPEAVLDAIERALARGQLWVFPGRTTALVWRLRRWVPGLVWSSLRRIEGVS
jgi:short-subunit dehydrogenase